MYFKRQGGDRITAGEAVQREDFHKDSQKKTKHGVGAVTLYHLRDKQSSET